MTKEEKKEYYKEYQKEYYKANKGKKAESNKEYRVKNKEKIKEYRQENREYYKEYNKEYVKVNKDKIAEYLKANKDKIAECSKEYYKANKGKKAEYTKANKEKIAEYNKQYKKVNKDKIAEYQKEYQKKKRKTDPLYKLKHNLRSSSSRVWKGTTKSATTEKLLGCSYIEFRDYITAQFVGNMTWENYGDVWHVDHIIPLATIENVNQIELIESLCHYSNLQPLFSEDNLSKHDKLDYEYPAIYKTNLNHNSNK